MLSTLLHCCRVLVMQIKLTVVVVDSPTWCAKLEWVDLICTWCSEFKPQMLTVAFELTCLQAYGRYMKVAAFEMSWLCTHINKLCKYSRISSFKLHSSSVTLLMHVCNSVWCVFILQHSREHLLYIWVL